MRSQLKLQTVLLASMLFVLGGVSSTFAQDEDPTVGKNRFNKFKFGVHVGHMLPFTDIRQYNYSPVFKYKNENKIGFGGNVNYSLSNVFSLQAKLIYGSLLGTRRGAKISDTGRLISDGSENGGAWRKETFDTPGKYPNGRYFKTNIFSYGLNLVVNISNVAFTPRDVGQQRKFGLYFQIGHGLAHYNATVYDLDTDRAYTKYQRGISGKTTEAVNPFGIGLVYKINSNIDVSLEVNMYRVNNDKLDGWVAGNSVDYFSYSPLTVSYKFGSAGGDAEHLDWVNPLETMYSDIQENKKAIAELSKDTDNDGVPDRFDKDGSTPEGTKVDGSGVALDVDKDGVPDSKDEDPFTDIGAEVDENGKAIDSDGDGVPDSRDLEANTEKGALVNFQGVTIGKSSGGGSGGVTPRPSGGGGVYFPSVYFDLNSSKIKYANYDRLATIARALKANPDLKLVMTGNADVTGDEAYNQRLGQRRAQAVADHLNKHYGIDKGRFTIESKGETQPLATGLNHINRRVDVEPGQ